jgi:hypothetical protein
MESGRLTKTTKTENYDFELKCWVFATLTDYTDDQYRDIATYRLRREGIENEELAQYIANAVLRGLGKRSFRLVGPL